MGVLKDTVESYSRAFPRIWAVLIVLLLYMLTLPFLLGFVPAVRFTGEEIVIRVYPDRIAVSGSFMFTNPFPFPVAQGFFFPVPVDSDHREPSFFTVTRLTPDRREIPVYGRGEKSRFDLFFKSRKKVDILVRYDQEVKEHNATYILTTTKMWKRPLEAGVYRLKPCGVRITGSNYTLSPDPSGGFYFEKKDFMPGQDWSFSWEAE